MLTRYSSVLTIATLTAIPVAWASLHAQKPAPGAQTTVAPVDFVRDIQPILSSICYECHGPKKTKAQLRLDSRAGLMKGGEDGAIITPGNSEQSLIVRRLLGLDGEDRMPKDGDPLPAAQIALIRAWIDQGALWPQTAASAEPDHPPPQHWAYRRPVRPALPEIHNAGWV